MTSRNTKADAPVPVNAEEEEIIDFAVMRKYEPVPADEPFIATITKWSRDKSQAGHGLINIQVETQKSREGAEDHIGKFISGRYSLQAQSLFSLFGVLVALGADPEELKIKPPSLASANYLGMSMIVFARDNVYQDTTTSQIRRAVHISKWDDILAGTFAGLGEGEGDDDSPNV